MTNQATPLNFGFRSFENDSNSVEEYFIIDNNVVVFNQNCVITVRIESIVDEYVTLGFDTIDGMTINKRFISLHDQIKEIPH